VGAGQAPPLAAVPAATDDKKAPAAKKVA
jgi:hypothetical protein